MIRFLKITIMLCSAMHMSCVFAQHPLLMNWYDNIEKIAYNIQTTENIYIKKEILCNGSVLPVAYGRFAYNDNDSSAEIIPFLYSYGRITVAKDMFDKMMTMPDSTKVDVFVAFQPISTSAFQKNTDNPGEISFFVRKRNLHDLYINRENLWLQSYWAITTTKDCYMVVYQDYSFCGFYYYIPYESFRRKRFAIKLEKLFTKQYKDGFTVLNYF